MNFKAIIKILVKIQPVIHNNKSKRPQQQPYIEIKM